MFKITKVGLASVVAGAVLAIGGSTAVAAPLATPAKVTAPLSAAPLNSPYPSSTGYCKVYPATITAGDYVAFVCKGFNPHGRVRIKGPHINKLRHAGRHGRILIVLHLKYAGVFTLSATGKSPYGTGSNHVATFTAVVTVLPS